jgi:hypothetical protein
MIRHWATTKLRPRKQPQGYGNLKSSDCELENVLANAEESKQLSMRLGNAARHCKIYKEKKRTKNKDIKEEIQVKYAKSSDTYGLTVKRHFLQFYMKMQR